MDFAERIKDLAARLPAQIEHIHTEEATKNALVMPFINALGYNVFDPREVTPELVADVGTKKGEKVDYAILKDGKPIMLFECKGVDCNLDTITPTQLYRYFSVTEVRIGILTNGVLYRFFSDLDAANKMDSKPFFEMSLQDLDDVVLGELKKFSRGTFEIAAILASASELKYTREIKRILAQELLQPSDELVRIYASRVYSGRMTQTIRDQFGEIFKRAFQQFISDRVSDRLKTALATEAQSAAGHEVVEEASAAHESSDLGTSDEERDGYNIVRAILSEVVDPRRIAMRDQQTYCSVLLDDSNRKPLCRMWFNSPRKYLSLFDATKAERKFALEDVAGIFRYSAELKESARCYLGIPATTTGQAQEAPAQSLPEASETQR